MGERSRCGVLFLRIVLIVLLGLSAGPGFGQAASNAPQSNAAANGEQQATPTFRASSRLVLVDVVVTDKSGQTVKGLKATDFTILEDGKPQPSRAFRTSRVAEDGGYDGEDQPATESIHEFHPATAEQCRERGAARHPEHAATRSTIRAQADDRNPARLPPNQRIALFVLGTKLRMIQGFSGSSDRLVAAAETILANTSPVLTTQSSTQTKSPISLTSPTQRRHRTGQSIADMEARTLRTALTTQSSCRGIGAPEYTRRSIRPGGCSRGLFRPKELAVAVREFPLPVGTRFQQRSVTDGG